jgi:hypothetical protein
MKAKVFQGAQVAGCHDVMSLIYEDQLEQSGVKFTDAISGRDTLNTGDSDVCPPRSMHIPHLDLYGLAGISIAAMPGRLLNEFPSMN